MCCVDRLRSQIKSGYRKRTNFSDAYSSLGQKQLNRSVLLRIKNLVILRVIFLFQQIFIVLWVVFCDFRVLPCKILYRVDGVPNGYQ